MFFKIFILLIILSCIFFVFIPVLFVIIKYTLIAFVILWLISLIKGKKERKKTNE